VVNPIKAGWGVDVLLQSNCTHAVRLHDVPDFVKRDRRVARRADTEARLIESARRLFIADGYAATTLAAVADAAGVAARTLYVRFATKADLLQRCLDAAIRGDEELDVLIDDRDWIRSAMTAPTADERIQLMAQASAGLMERAGALLRVAQQAEAMEPAIAARAQAARLDTQRVLESFWRQMAADDLLGSDIDIDWLAVTGAALGQAETYLVLSKVVDWDIEAYRAWLQSTWCRIAGIAPASR
jgi:AcrR family transcriptional regulator